MSATGAPWREGDLIDRIVEAIGDGVVVGDDGRDSYGVAAAIDPFALVASQTSAEEWLSLVRAGSVLQSQGWSLPEGAPDLVRVAEAYRAGYSLVMRRLHLRVAAVGQLARRLDRALADGGHLLRRAVRSNLFASPAGAEGLALHYDDHDVAVLQLSGEKSWTVFEPAYRDPIGPPSRHLTPDDCGEMAFSGTLRPGSLLFVPRGFPHQAHTTEAASVHITLGAESCTWLDVVNELAAEHEPLRRNVALNRASAEQAGLLAAVLGDEEAVGRALADLAEEWTRSAVVRPDDLDWDAPASPLTPATRVRRGGLALSVMVEIPGGEGVLCTQAMRLEGGPGQRQLLDFLHQRLEFVVGELPGGFGDDAKVALVKKLLTDGLLEVVEERAAPIEAVGIAGG